MAKNERRYLTAVTIDKGIITLLDEYGRIQQFRQRGIKRIPEVTRKRLIYMNELERDWEEYRELPRDVTISFEDEFIMGKARASFPIKKYKGILF